MTLLVRTSESAARCVSVDDEGTVRMGFHLQPCSIFSFNWANSSNRHLVELETKACWSSCNSSLKVSAMTPFVSPMLLPYN